MFDTVFGVLCCQVVSDHPHFKIVGNLFVLEPFSFFKCLWCALLKLVVCCSRQLELGVCDLHIQIRLLILWCIDMLCCFTMVKMVMKEIFGLYCQVISNYTHFNIMGKLFMSESFSFFKITKVSCLLFSTAWWDVICVFKIGCWCF